LTSSWCCGCSSAEEATAGALSRAGGGGRSSTRTPWSLIARHVRLLDWASSTATANGNEAAAEEDEEEAAEEEADEGPPFFWRDRSAIFCNVCRPFHPCVFILPIEAISEILLARGMSSEVRAFSSRKTLFCAR